LVKFWTKEILFSSNLLSLFKSKLCLETWLEESEGSWDLIMKLEHGCIEVESCPEDDVSSWMPQIEALP